MVVFVALLQVITLFVIIVITSSKEEKSKLNELYQLVLKSLIVDKDNIWNKELSNNQGICTKMIRLMEDNSISYQEYEVLIRHFHSVSYTTVNSYSDNGKMWYGYYFPCTKEGNLERIKLIERILKTV